MKKWLFLTFSIICLGLGFLHIPILAWCGVDVFALRGVLIFTYLPIVAVSAIPLAIFISKYTKNNQKHKEK